jgi:hypothetical protein
MIPVDKAFLAVVQTICVGGLCVGWIASNADELYKNESMAVAVLGGLVITVASGTASVGLAYEEKKESHKSY